MRYRFARPSFILFCSLFVTMMVSIQVAAGTTITWWDPDVRVAYRSAVQYVIDEFTRKNPDVKFEISTVPWDQLNAKMISGYRAGTLPDMASSVGTWYGSLAWMGILQPVTDVISEIGESEFPPSLLTAVTIQGERYQVPWDTVAHILVYRVDWYKEAGLEEPKTWADLLFNTMALDNPDKRYGFILYNTRSEPEPLLDLMGCNGSYTFDAENNVVIDNYRTVEALYMLRELYDHSLPGVWVKGETEARYPFLDGAGAHMMTSTTIADVIASKPEEIPKFKAVPIPRNHGNLGGMFDFNGIVIPSSTEGEKLKLVKDFLLHWFDKDVYIEFAKRTILGTTPSLLSVVNNSEYWETPRIAKVSSFLRAGCEAGKISTLAGQAFGPNPYAGIAISEAVWKEMADRVCILREDPKQVASWAQKRLESLIREMQ